MTPELRWLGSFLAVAEEQHFSRAARRLNLAQPALTAHIQHLEAALGSTLFERTNRMGGLTAAGRGYKDMADAVDTFEASVLERKLVHDGNPVLTWNVSNAMVISDPAGNRKIAKDKTRFRIDAVVALCMALGALRTGTQYRIRSGASMKKAGLP